MIAAQRAADPHTVPGIRNAEAVGAKYVDAVRLANRPDLARVMHRDFLGDHDDLFELRVHAHQLGDAVAHAGGGQIDDAAVEREPVVEPFPHIVVDRDVAHRRREHLAAAPRRSAENHIATGKSMTDRCNLSRLPTHDIEDAHAIGTHSHITQRVDAEVVGKSRDALLVHGPLLGLAQFACCRPKWAAISLRPPAFIQASTALV